MQQPSNKFKSLSIEIIGWLLVLVGIAALILPGPGLLALFAGLTLLSTRYKWAQRHVAPVQKAALKAARDSVANPIRIAISTVAALGLIGLGIFWGLGSGAPQWWPVADKYWLIGGWGTGSTLIFSGILAAAMILYSYLRFRKQPNSFVGR